MGNDIHSWSWKYIHDTSKMTNKTIIETKANIEMFNNKMVVIQKQTNQLNFSFQEILQSKELLISTWNAIVNSRLSEEIEPTFELCKYVMSINIWYHTVSPYVFLNLVNTTSHEEWASWLHQNHIASFLFFF
jgi:hypothetical protein